VNAFDKARQLLHQFKGESYLYGAGVLCEVGRPVRELGRRAALVRSTFAGSDDFVATILDALGRASVDVAHTIHGPRPNAPREDVIRIARELAKADPDVVVCFGGGSCIDATKAAEVLRTVGGVLEDYFGTGLVTEAIGRTGSPLSPLVAIQTAASSGAHLTKYSNITDLTTGQKKLIVDEAVVPQRPVFDYRATYGAPRSLATDGALDGISHLLEVLYGAVGKPYYETAETIAETGIGLIVAHLPNALADPDDKRARDALCLGTDLGGCAIMVGGTNGGHLTSFSLVDILSHGRACAIMNPFYTVFFAPAVERPLRTVGRVFKDAGYAAADLDSLSGRELGLEVAESMHRFSREIGFPTSLGGIEGFTDEHVERALKAAKNPQLRMKLQNMPIPLMAEQVDEYMGSVLEAAKEGDLAIVRNL
jgi:alcohol dehydrogenase class IV